MTSPTKNKIINKNNSDMLMLQEINAELYQTLKSNLDFISNADIKQFISDPDKLSSLLLSKELIEKIEKLLLTAKVEKLQTSLYSWQTELIFHYNRLLGQVKSQPYPIIIEFLKKNYAVDLMQLHPLTPRKRARLEARAKKDSTLIESENLDNPSAQLPHYKATVARKLRFDENENESAKSQVNELKTDIPKISPRF